MSSSDWFAHRLASDDSHDLPRWLTSSQDWNHLSSFAVWPPQNGVVSVEPGSSRAGAARGAVGTTLQALTYSQSARGSRVVHADPLQRRAPLRCSAGRAALPKSSLVPSRLRYMASTHDGIAFRSWTDRAETVIPCTACTWSAAHTKHDHMRPCGATPAARPRDGLRPHGVELRR